jgi:hypothetical protein
LVGGDGILVVGIVEMEIIGADVVVGRGSWLASSVTTHKSGFEVDTFDMRRVREWYKRAHATKYAAVSLMV